MTIDDIVALIGSFDGSLDLAPVEGGPFPEIAWGDHFFYYAPDGQVPQREQPYATIVTKNYPDDADCDLDRPDRWRLNIHVGSAAFTELTGQDPRSTQSSEAAFEVDTVIPHPVYRRQGWVSVITPGPRTESLVVDLLGQAHRDAERRAAR